MDNVKWCTRVWFFVLVFCKVVASDNNYDQYRNLISEDERRGVTGDFHNLKQGENVKRGLFLTSKFKNPASLVVPARYDVKEQEHGFEHHHKYPHYPPLGGSRDGYGYGAGAGALGGYYGHQQPVEFGTGIAHLPGGVYSHTGLGSYGGAADSFPHEYPAGSYDHTTGIGYAGGDKNYFGLKKFLLPLAGIAILGAAAALTANPVLLQLGAITGKRRRRGANVVLLKTDAYPQNRFVKPNKTKRVKKN